MILSNINRFYNLRDVLRGIQMEIEFSDAIYNELYSAKRKLQE